MFVLNFILISLLLFYNSVLFHKCFISSFSISSTLPTGQLSSIPWRRTGVKYTNNEAYFDIIEEVDAIIDKSGSVISAEIQGCVSFLYY